MAAKQRRPSVAAQLSALAMPLCLFALQANTRAASQVKTNPTITSTQLSTSFVSSSGGPVTITADVTDTAASLSTVTATVTCPGASPVDVPLTQVVTRPKKHRPRGLSSGTFQGTFDAPSNPGAEIVCSVSITAVDNLANQSTVDAGTFVIDAGTVGITTGLAAGSGVVDASEVGSDVLGNPLQAIFALHVKSTGGGNTSRKKPRAQGGGGSGLEGVIRVDVPNTPDAPGGVLRIVATSIDSFLITDTPDGRVAEITGTMRVNTLGSVPFDLLVLDGDTPGVPADGFFLTVDTGKGTASLGGNLEFNRGGDTRLLNDVVVEPGI